MVIRFTRARAVFTALLILAVSLGACHKEEQVVVGVAKNAAQAEHKAQTTATELDSERDQLEQIPLPTKSLYVDVHDPAAWANPFLFVKADTISLRILLSDANPNPAGPGDLLRPEAARRQQLELRLSDLNQAIVAIPAGSWRYGRVVAVAESPDAPPADRPKVRRNIEATIKHLNDLGVVVEEWPSR